MPSTITGTNPQMPWKPLGRCASHYFAGVVHLGAARRGSSAGVQPERESGGPAARQWLRHGIHDGFRRLVRVHRAQRHPELSHRSLGRGHRPRRSYPVRAGLGRVAGRRQLESHDVGERRRDCKWK